MEWTEFEGQIKHLKPAARARVKQAFELGKRVHAGQMRKSGEPYFTHPIEVALMLAAMGADEETIIVALLHDTVEDTPVTIEQIGEQFGPSVQHLIDGLTKLTADDFAARPTLNEQTETLRKMFRLMQQDVRIMVIKLADRLHNMQTVRFLKPERQVTLASETLDIYVKVASKLSMQDLRDELESICLQITEPSVHEVLSALRRTSLEQSEQIIADFYTHFTGEKTMKNVRLAAEFQPWEKQRLQLGAMTSTISALPRHTIAFICGSVEQCYAVLGQLHGQWPSEVLSFQDFINSPVMNGYRGLHTTIILENGTRVRCKIRTEEMHAYAHRGITQYCFDGKAKDHLSYLPWVQRIAPLAEDTKDRSEEFWDSLQSDILGQSILVYATDNRSASLPAGSTAIDAAFYLYPQAAMRLESIRVKGQGVPLYQPMEHGDTLDIQLSATPTVQRDWLNYAQTGYATAAIRSALVEGKSDTEKVSIGRELLQLQMTKQRGGFLEEFNQKMLAASASTLGYNSLESLYAAIADGHVDAATAYTGLFKPATRRGTAGQRRRRCVLHLRIERSDESGLKRLLELTQAYASQIKNMQISEISDRADTTVDIVLSLSIEEQSTISKQLASIGAKDVDIVMRTGKELALLSAVIIPWALNPVAAKWFLFHGVDPLPLITIRLVIFALFTIAFFIAWRIISRTPFTPIKHLTLRVLPSTFGNLGMTVSTYLALLQMPPSLHLLLLRLNTVLLPTISKRWTFSRAIAILSFILLFFAGFAGLLIPAVGFHNLWGVLLSLSTLLLYLFYSLTTERTLRQNRIDMRHPYLLLHMGGLLGISGIVMALFQPWDTLWNDMTLGVIGYVLFCVCLPHAAYSALLNRTRFKYFTDLLLLEVPIAIALETLLLGLVLTPYAYALTATTLLALLFWRWRKLSLPF